MGEYARKLDIYEYDQWLKRVKKFLIEFDLSIQDISRMTGYAVGTVYDSLNSYERCSRFFVAALDEAMEGYEKDN